MDQLSTLLSGFGFSARVVYNGTFSGASSFNDEGQRGRLHLVRNGPITIHHDDRLPLHVAVPSLVFYPRGLNHRLSTSAGSAPSLFCAEIAVERDKHSPLTKALPDCVQLPLTSASGLGPVLGLLFDEAATDRSGQHLVLNRLCEVLIVQLIRHEFQSNQRAQGILSGLADPGLSRALVAIHGDPGQPWKVEALARISAMSRSKFAKHFHQVVGTTPAEYLADRRMELARRLLKKNKPVRTVALEVGYGSQPAFTKAFTAKCGKSPRRWLNSLRAP
jgi:AraC-like DNA-binding protein